MYSAIQASELAMSPKASPPRRSKSKILRKTKNNLIEFAILVYLNQRTESPLFSCLRLWLKGPYSVSCNSKNVLNSQSFQDLV